MILEDMEDRLYCYRATCKTVIDGDTVDLDIDLGLRVMTRQRVRLAGLDAPEIHGVKKGSEEFLKGIDAAAEVVRLLKPKELGHGLKGYIKEEDYEGSPTDLWVETIKDKVGKYGRFLAKIWVWQDGTILDLNKHLVEKGLVKRVDY